MQLIKNIPVDHVKKVTLALAKAARELRQAERRKPTDPRPHVYLAEVYDRLGQPTAARTAAGRVRLPDAGLTEVERVVVRKLAESSGK